MFLKGNKEEIMAQGKGRHFQKAAEMWNKVWRFLFVEKFVSSYVAPVLHSLNIA